MQVFIKLKRFWPPYAKWGIASVLSMALLAAIGLVRPWLLEQLIDRVIEHGRYNELPYWALAVIEVAAVRAIFNFGRQYLGQVLGQNATFDLRNSMYDKLQYLHFKFYDNARTGDLMSRVTSDVEAFRMFRSSTGSPERAGRPARCVPAFRVQGWGGKEIGLLPRIAYST